VALPHPDAHPDEEVPDGLERKFKSPGRKSTQRLRDHTRWVGGAGLYGNLGTAAYVHIDVRGARKRWRG